MVAVTYGSARITTASAAPAKIETARKGFFARFMQAMMDARLRQAYREIELHQHLLHGWQQDERPRGR